MSEVTVNNALHNMLDIDLMIETIKIRRSVRTFQDVPLKGEDIELIKEYLDTEELLKGPLGKEFRIELLINTAMENELKIGTYGYVKNPQGYLVGISGNDYLTLFDIAYVFHGLVLYLTSKGIATCWLGGIFNQDSVGASTYIGEDEIVPAISPLGYTNDKKHIFGKLANKLLKPHIRKPVEEIAFYKDFDTAFTKNDSPIYEAIYIGSLAPNAQNKQPWRIVISEDYSILHLFVKFNLKKQVHNKFRGYACPPEYLDIAIFYRQFEVAMKNNGIEGELFLDDPGLKLPTDDMGYVISWRMK